MPTALPDLCFVFVFFFSKSGGQNNPKYAFQYTFNNNTTQYTKKEGKKERRMDLHDDIRAKSPIQFLTLTDRA